MTTAAATDTRMSFWEDPNDIRVSAAGDGHHMEYAGDWLIPERI